MSKGISRSNHDDAHLHPQPMTLPSINFVHLMIPRYSPDKLIKVKIMMERSKLHSNVVHLYPHPICPPSMKFLYDIFSEIQPRQDMFPGARPINQPNHPLSRMPWVKTIPVQSLLVNAYKNINQFSHSLGFSLDLISVRCNKQMVAKVNARYLTAYNTLLIVYSYYDKAISK